MRTKWKWRSVFALSLVSLLGLLLMSGAITGDGEEADAQAPAADTSTVSVSSEVEEAETESVAVAGIQVAIDPDTGRLRPPTDEEVTALRSALLQMFGASESPTVTVRDDGVESALLGASQCKMSVVTVNDDGALTHGCVDGPQGALRMLEEAANSPSHDVTR